MLIDSLANGKESLKRIATYLAREELTPYVQHLPKSDNGGSVELRNGNFLWSAANQPDIANGEQRMGAPALCDASLNVGPGEVVAVVGSVATGKSALCKSLIGELAPVPRVVVDQSDGDKTEMFSRTSDIPSVVVRGKISYAAQEAWVPQGSLRDAVVFGREYDEERYLSAIYDAGLEDDIANGPLSHDMDVGEDGSNLSGGQRARVALARALYDDSAGVVILDDVLAALDASVGSIVFERVVSRLRRQRAATIFVTNDDSLPRFCDKVILMGNSPGNPQCSRVVDTGTYSELCQRGHDIRSFCHPELQIDSKETEGKESEESEESGSSSYDISARNATMSDCHADPDDSAGVVILDDVLAALDASVGSIVFERVVSRLRRQRAATIFVTNDDSLPRFCDKVILMGNSPGNPQCSRVVDTGTYSELCQRGHDIRSFCHPELQIDSKETEGKESEESEESGSSSYDISARNATMSDCHADPDCKVQMEQDPTYIADHTIPQPIEPTEYADTGTIVRAERPKESSFDNQEDTSSTAATPPKKQKQISIDDEMKAGAVPRSTYMTYFRAIRSPLLICAALGAYLAGNAAQMAQQLIIARWSEVGKAEITQAISSKYLNQLVWGAGFVSIFFFFRSYLTMRVGVRASRFIHEKMVESVFKAPLSYFSATPSGQLLSRFGRELDVVDGVPDGISSVLFCFLQIFFSVLALA